jgi:hypothetical protein
MYPGVIAAAVAAAIALMDLRNGMENDKASGYLFGRQVESNGFMLEMTFMRSVAKRFVLR